MSDQYEKYKAIHGAMTGKWGELRDLARDEPIARAIIDTIVHDRMQAVSTVSAEDVLLHAVLVLVRENAQLRSHVLRGTMSSGTP